MKHALVSSGGRIHTSRKKKKKIESPCCPNQVEFPFFITLHGALSLIIIGSNLGTIWLSLRLVYAGWRHKHDPIGPSQMVTCKATYLASIEPNFSMIGICRPKIPIISIHYLTAVRQHT